MKRMEFSVMSIYNSPQNYIISSLETIHKELVKIGPNGNNSNNAFINIFIIITDASGYKSWLLSRIHCF